MGRRRIRVSATKIPEGYEVGHDEQDRGRDDEGRECDREERPDRPSVPRESRDDPLGVRDEDRAEREEGHEKAPEERAHDERQRPKGRSGHGEEQRIHHEAGAEVGEHHHQGEQATSPGHPRSVRQEAARAGESRHGREVHREDVVRHYQGRGADRVDSRPGERPVQRGSDDPDEPVVPGEQERIEVEQDHRHR